MVVVTAPNCGVGGAEENPNPAVVPNPAVWPVNTRRGLPADISLVTHDRRKRRRGSTEFAA
jgi:hypothetical protein